AAGPVGPAVETGRASCLRGRGDGADRTTHCNVRRYRGSGPDVRRSSAGRGDRGTGRVTRCRGAPARVTRPARTRTGCPRVVGRSAANLGGGTGGGGRRCPAGRGNRPVRARADP